MKRLLLILLLAIPSATQAADALHTLAASMSAGQWAELVTNNRNNATGNAADIVAGYTKNYPSPYASEGALPFSTKIEYDQAHGLVQYFGGVHTNNAAPPTWACDNVGTHYDPVICGNYQKYFYTYALASNNWDYLVDAVTGYHHPGGTFTGEFHGDARYALDAATGDTYTIAKNQGSTVFFKFSYAAHSWSMPANQPGSSLGYGSAINSIEWFPDASGLISISGDYGGNDYVGFFDGTSWSTIFTLNPTGYPVAIYNAHNHEMLIGSGGGASGTEVMGRTFYIIARNAGTWQFKKTDGTFTTTASAAARVQPAEDICAQGGNKFFDATHLEEDIVAEPTTGHYLLVTRDATASCLGQVKDYDPGGGAGGTGTTTESWSNISTTVPPLLATAMSGQAGGVGFGKAGFLAGGPINDAGVTFWLSSTGDPMGNGWTVWLFKYSGSGTGGDTTAPTAPTCSSTAITATSSEIMCTGATDAVGVTGYNFYQGGVLKGNSAFPIWNFTGLTAGTAYALTAKAFDAASNLSAASNTVSITTTGQLYTYAQKCNTSLFPGVVKCRPFDSQSEIKYTWGYAPISGASDSGMRNICQNAMASLYTNYGYYLVGGLPWPATVANSRAVVNNGNCSFPVIDTTVKHSGAGSIKFIASNHSGANSAGEFSEPISQVSTSSFGYFGPDQTGILQGQVAQPHLGDDLWIQWYQNIGAGMLQHFDSTLGLQLGQIGDFTTPGAGSLTLNDPSCRIAGMPGFTTAGVIGRSIWFQQGSHFTLFTPFLIDNLTSDGCTYTMHTSPTPTGAGGSPELIDGMGPYSTPGFGSISNPVATNPGSRADGWKQFGLFGEPPASTCCFPGVQASVATNQLNVPVGYSDNFTGTSISYQDNRGCPFTTYLSTDYTEPPCVKYHGGQWQEYTIHLKINSRTGAFNSVLERWVDGQKVSNDSAFGVSICSTAGCGPPYVNGIGQYNLNVYDTNKDPNQDTGDIPVYYDDIIFSTQPIPMLSADVVSSIDTLAFSSNPTNVVSGSAFSPQVAVTASLAAGGTDTAFTGSVTLNLNSCGAVSTGTPTQTAVAGVATFPGLGATTAATGCIYTATSSGLSSVTSSSFNVTGGVVIASGSGRAVLRTR